MSGVTIASHQIANFEGCEVAIHELQAIVYAMDLIMQGSTLITGSDPTSTAVNYLFGQIIQTAADLQRLHSMEWAGHGGNTTSLSAQDIMRARGKVPG